MSAKIREAFGEHFLLRGAFEVVLIVVGVLVALGIDAWQEERRNRDVERNYLEELLADMRTDAEEFSLIVIDLDADFRASQLLQEIIGGADASGLSKPEFGAILACATFLPSPTVSRVTFDDLLSTGNLTLLRDRAVRRRVVAYYADIDSANQFRDEMSGYQAALREILLEVSTLRSSDADAIDIDAVTETVRGDPRYLPAVQRMLFAQRRSIVRARSNYEASVSAATVLEDAIQAVDGDPDAVAHSVPPYAQFDSACADVMNRVSL